MRGRKRVEIGEKTIKKREHGRGKKLNRYSRLKFKDKRVKKQEIRDNKKEKNRDH